MVSTFEEGERNPELRKPTYDIAAQFKEGKITYEQGLDVLLKAAKHSNYPETALIQMFKSAIRKKPGRAKNYYKNVDIKIFCLGDWESFVSELLKEG